MSKPRELAPAAPADSASVIICTYRGGRLDWLIEAVESLSQQTRMPNEVIVVFDKSDGFEEELRRSLPASVKIIPNRASKGLSLARNTGLEAATSNIVVFLDDDACAESDWLKNILSPFADHMVMGTGGKAVPQWLGSGKRPSWFPEELDWTVGCMHPGFGDKRKVVRNVFGSNMAFRRARLLEIGGFNPKLGGPISGDDTDICMRATAADNGYSIVYEPGAVVHHKVPQTRQTFHHVAYEAWINGIGKAANQRMLQGDSRALSDEKVYLKSLVFRFLPRQLGNLFRHPLEALGKIAVVSAFVALIGTGFILTRLRILHSVTDKYKAS